MAPRKTRSLAKNQANQEDQTIGIDNTMIRDPQIGNQQVEGDQDGNQPNIENQPASRNDEVAGLGAPQDDAGRMQQHIDSLTEWVGHLVAVVDRLKGHNNSTLY